MRLTKPVYEFKGKKQNKRAVIQFDFNQSYKGYALNFTQGVWLDQKYSLVKQLLRRFDVVVTDSDLLACEDYIEVLINSNTAVIIYFSKQPWAASKKRQRNAYLRLKQAGVNAIWRASEESMLKTLQNMEAK